MHEAHSDGTHRGAPGGRKKSSLLPAAVTSPLCGSGDPAVGSAAFSAVFRLIGSAGSVSDRGDSNSTGAMDTEFTGLRSRSGGPIFVTHFFAVIV